MNVSTSGFSTFRANDPLLEFPNVVITPHIGSARHATRLKMAELAVDNLIDVFEGRKLRHCANPAVRTH
jgi:lactate dehydrogenase-like 2-hydroxyacid dehydrogenase